MKRWAVRFTATRRQRRLLRTAISLLPVLLAVLHLLGFLPWAGLRTLDDELYDWRLRGVMPRTLDERVVIVDIDEASLGQFGHWPWRRDRVAALVDEVVDRQQAAVMAFDVVFAEPDGSSPLPGLRALADGPLKATPGLHERIDALAGQWDYDARFAQALHGRPVVLGYYLTSDRARRRAGALPAPVWPPSTPRLAVTHWDGYGSNLPLLAQAAAAMGYFNPVTDADGQVRAVPMLAELDGAYYEALALATIRVWAAGGRGEAARATLTPLSDAATGHMQGLRLGYADGRTQTIGTDVQAAALVPYRGPGGPNGGSFRYVSAADLLSGRLPAASLAGRIVLVGSTAPGLQDLRATPAGETYPGVEVHANLIAGLMDGRIPVRPDYAPGYELVTVLALGLLLALGLPRLTLGPATLLTAGGVGSLLLLDASLFLSAALVLPLATALVMAAAVAVLNLVLSYMLESRTRRQLAALFGVYVPPELVREMLEDPQRYSMQAQARTLTVMFCDLRGFTRMAEDMAPTDVQALLGALFTRVTACIRQNGGTIDKYIGDCVMAFWGAPVAQPDHARRAVATALAIQADVARFNDERAAAGLSPVPVSIGLNSGMMAVGDMGSDVRRAYTVIGDAVNLAARIEAITREYGVDIAAGEATQALTADDFIWQPIDRVQVKGRQRQTQLYEPLGTPEQLTPDLAEELALWQESLAALREQQPERAAAALHALRVKNSTKSLYALYEKRLRLPAAADPGG